MEGIYYRPLEDDESPTPPQKTLQREIENIINRYSRENESDTPDFILAQYLMDCLKAFETATKARNVWYERGKIFIPTSGESMKIITGKQSAVNKLLLNHCITDLERAYDLMREETTIEESTPGITGTQGIIRK